MTTVWLVAAALAFPFAAAITLLVLLSLNWATQTRVQVIEVFVGLMFACFIAANVGIFVNGLWTTFQG